MTYSVKPATTIDQQVTLLKGRGLVITDEVDAKATLRRISYYRLSGYLVEYKRPDGTYLPGTQLSTIYAIYEFDRHFRNNFYSDQDRAVPCGRLPSPSIARPNLLCGCNRSCHPIGDDRRRDGAES